MKETIGLMLLHFLWQGALVALLLLVANTLVLRRASANARYVAACCALAVMALCCVATFQYLTPVIAIDTAVPGVFAALPPAAHGAALDISPRSIAFLDWLAYAWLAGVVVLSMRSFASWLAAQQLRTRGVRAASEEWLERARRIADRLAIRKAVAIVESGVAEVPAVIGWLRPVVLIPVSAIAGLDAAQLETLLAHELAHVRRHDYLVNLLQTAIETLLFFHPAVWWVSRIIRAERENCCDDLAVAVCGDKLRYARALAALEQLRGDQRFALAATDGSLLKRIERLLGGGDVSTSARLRWIPVAILSALAIVITGAQAHSQAVAASAAVQQDPAPVAAEPAPLPEPAPAPAPQAQPEKAADSHEDYIDSLAAAGLKGLSVDQLIALKIHGVTGDYIREMKALGYNLPPDELAAFKIHGIAPEYVNQLKSQGWQLNNDQLLAFRIHGVDAQSIDRLRALGFKLTADEAIAMKIHGVTPEFAKSWQDTGVKGIDFEKLLALKIHGADPSAVKEYAGLGFHDIDLDNILSLKIMGVTPEYVREVQKRGFQDLKLDQIIQLRQMNIIPLNKK